MNALIIFDSANNAAIKSQLSTLGYYSQWVANNQNYILPNNCMWKPNCELSQAKRDIQSISQSLGFMGLLHRCIVLSVNPWDGIPGTLIP